MKSRFWIILALALFIVVINGFVIANSKEFQMAQAPTQQPQQQQRPQGGLPMSKAQEMAVGQMANQQPPFGWLIDMIKHITGGSAGQVEPAPTTKPPQAGQAGKDKRSDAGAPGQAGQPGQIDPGQVPQLANVMQANPATNMNALGLLPQTQGSFGWLLQMMQKQQMMQQQAQGGGLVQLANSLVDGGGAAAGSAPTAGAGATSAGGGAAPVAGG